MFHFELSIHVIKIVLIMSPFSHSTRRTIHVLILFNVTLFYDAHRGTRDPQQMIR